MTFVYMHILWFGCWIGLGAEDYPFGLLTMIVSLELSRRILRLTTEVRAYGDTVQDERDRNRELLALSKQTLALTREAHSVSGAGRPADPGASGRADEAEPAG